MSRPPAWFQIEIQGEETATVSGFGHFALTDPDHGFGCETGETVR